MVPESNSLRYLIENQLTKQKSQPPETYIHTHFCTFSTFPAWFSSLKGPEHVTLPFLSLTSWPNSKRTLLVCWVLAPSLPFSSRSRKDEGKMLFVMSGLPFACLALLKLDLMVFLVEDEKDWGLASIPTSSVLSLGCWGSPGEEKWTNFCFKIFYVCRHSIKILTRNCAKVSFYLFVLYEI